MVRISVAMFVLIACLSFPGAIAQHPSSSVEALTHLYRYKIVKKELIDINGVVDSELTKTAYAIESNNTPSAPWHIVVSYRNGDKDLNLLLGGDDERFGKGVAMEDRYRKRRALLHHISPCDWSLDGSNLLVSGQDYDQFSHSVWSINVKAMHGTPISSLRADEHAYNAKFSPDGEEVAYVSAPIKHEDNRRSTAYSDNKILRYNLATGKTTQVTNGLLTQWSPNSKRLLAVTETQIWVMDKDGTHKKKIYPTPDNNKYNFQRYPGFHIEWEDYRSLAWLDDSHLVVEVNGKNHSTDVLILDDQGHVVQIIPRVRLSRVWGAKKRLLLVEKLSDDKYKIWSVNY